MKVRHFRNEKYSPIDAPQVKIYTIQHVPLVCFNNNLDICVIFFSFQSFVHIISSLYINILLISINM